jgi:signal transduction histidine kinase/DNA-binding response OmpR family regulator
MTRLLAVELRHERDVVLARQRTRRIADLLGFDPQDQARLATAVSEVARNAVQYGGGGRVEFAAGARSLKVTVQDHGPGIADLTAVLDGRSFSGPVPGNGLTGARRLMDEFVIQSAPGSGTTVGLEKHLPRSAPGIDRTVLARVSAELAKPSADDALSEVQHQNQELLRLLGDLRDREARLAELNRELEETNRGVVALYAELEEKADSLRRVSELKTRFLSNMSHEFRTPLNSILSLAQLLLDRADGPLTEEQEKQVLFVRRAAHGLSELVNDLLDLAKVEAGKVVVRPEEFRAADLFAALRGMMRPLLTTDTVSLVFEEAGAAGVLHTDEGKVSQILRNFVSNALKFTEQGEVRVSAAAGPGDTVVFAVADSGIGIALADQDRIFEEFGQLESPLQKKVKGTGLGLPLSKRLAELLGGRVSVRSDLGAGSTFYLSVPRVYTGPSDARATGAAGRARQLDPGRATVLVVENDPTAMLLYEKFLAGSGFQVIGARTCAEARELLGVITPAAVILDILLEAESGWGLLTELKEAEATRPVPVVVVSVVDGADRAAALGADAFCRKPVERDWLVRRLRDLARRGPAETVLVIDDDEIARYLLRSQLDPGRFSVVEAIGGEEGLRRVRDSRPRVVFLDLVMPDLSGFEVLDRRKADPETRDIPVILYTSQLLDEADRRRLAGRVAATLAKGVESSREAAARLIQDALVAAGLGPPAVEPAHA